VPFLLEFILSNVSAKTSTKLSQYEHAAGLVCYFMRFSLTPPMLAERHLWGLDDVRPPWTLKGYEPHEHGLAEEKYPLSPDNFSFLIQSDFFEICLKEGVQTEELGKMLAHLAYKHPDFSMRVCRLLLNGISRNDYDKIKNYLQVVNSLALIKDELQNSRLEWLFGFGSLVSHTSSVSITNN